MSEEIVPEDRPIFATSTPAVPAAIAAVGIGPVIVAVATLLLHLIAAGRYGIFRDEFYYLACADHLGWGYVDHPPFSLVMLAGWRAVFGDGVLAIRLPGILLHAGLILGGGWLAGRLGGRAFARTLAACAVAVVPAALALCGFYSMNSWDLAFWFAMAGLVTLLLDGRDRRLWLVLGAVAGVGLLNKYSLGWYLVGLCVGLLCSPLRRDLRTRWPWLALGLAVLLFAPHIVWQVQHGWPSLEFIENARRYKIAALGPVGFWSEQLLMGHPTMLPLWLIGAGALLFARNLARYRPLGVAFVVVAAWLTVAQGKPYYLAPVYPVLLVAGAVQLEHWVRRIGRPAWRRTVEFAVCFVVITSGLAIAPLAIPLLPVETFIAYQETLGLKPASGERSSVGVLPQHYADRFGWFEMAEDVANVVSGLSRADRSSCLVITGNYGEAGSLEYYWSKRADRDELPPVTSTHNSYHLWGPGVESADVVIVVGSGQESLEQWFGEVALAATHHAEYVMPYEDDLPIWVCRGWRRPLAEVWPEIGHYI